MNSKLKPRDNDVIFGNWDHSRNQKVGEQDSQILSRNKFGWNNDTFDRIMSQFKDECKTARF